MRILNKCQKCDAEGTLHVWPGPVLQDGLLLGVMCHQCGHVTEIVVELVAPCRICGVAPAQTDTDLCEGCEQALRKAGADYGDLYDTVGPPADDCLEPTESRFESVEWITKQEDLGW